MTMDNNFESEIRFKKSPIRKKKDRPRSSQLLGTAIEGWETGEEETPEIKKDEE